VFLLATARWVLSLLARHPLLWLWAALMAAVWPAVLIFTPIGTTTAGHGSALALHELAFVALLLGALAGLLVVQKGQWFLEPLSPGRRLATEFVALSAAGPVFLLAALVPAIILGGAGGAPTWWLLPARVLLAHLHLSAIGLVLLRIPLGPAPRLVALPLAVWVLPALLSSAGSWPWRVAAWLEASRPLRLSADSLSLGTALSSALAPTIGMLALALLLSQPPISIAHAVRNSR